MKFYKGKVMYSVIRTNDTTSENIPIFTYAAWNEKGQQVDAGEVVASCIEHAKSKIMSW